METIEKKTNGNEKDKFSLRYQLKNTDVYELPDGLGQFSIADFDKKDNSNAAMLDIIFPITTGNPSLLLASNQIKIAYNWENVYCDVYKYNNIKNDYPPIFIPFSINEKDNNIFEKIIEKNGLEQTIKYDPTKNMIINLSSEDTEEFNSELMQPILRVGDVDTDSHPDITFTIKKTNGDNYSKVFFNCKAEVQDTKNALVEIRYFTDKCKGIETLSIDEKNAVYSSFFDLDENGQLDILVIYKEIKDKVYYKLKAYYNNYSYDSFFLKSLNSIYQNMYASYNVGVSYRYIITNLNSSRRMDVNTQGHQLGCSSLNLPYTLIGIGRSNNYIENFQVISSTFIKSEGNLYKNYTPIIPNSQLLISERNDLNSENVEWGLNLFISPTDKWVILVIVIAACLLVLLVIIVILHSKEIREDQENENMIFTQWFN